MLYVTTESSVISGLRSLTTLLWTISGCSDLSLFTLLIVPLPLTIQFVTQPHIHPLGRRSLIEKYTQSLRRKHNYKKFFYSFCCDLMFSEYSLLCLAINYPAKFLFGFLFFIYLKKNLYDISCLLQVVPQTLFQPAFICIYL